MPEYTAICLSHDGFGVRKAASTRLHGGLFQSKIYSEPLITKGLVLYSGISPPTLQHNNGAYRKKAAKYDQRRNSLEEPLIKFDADMAVGQFRATNSAEEDGIQYRPPLRNLSP